MNACPPHEHSSALTGSEADTGYSEDTRLSRIWSFPSLSSASMEGLEAAGLHVSWEGPVRLGPTWAKGLRGDAQRIVLFAEGRAMGREAVLVCGMLSLPLSPGKVQCRDVLGKLSRGLPSQ